MGTKTSSEKYFEKVVRINQQIINGPPHFIEMTNSQKNSLNLLNAKLDNTCIACKFLKKYSNAVFLAEPCVEVCLPGMGDSPDLLVFEKKHVLNNSTEQIYEINYHSKWHGFLPHFNISYLGRLLLAMQTTLKDDLKKTIDLNNQCDSENNTDNENQESFEICKASVDESMDELQRFCSLIPKEYKNNEKVVWISHRTDILTDKYSKINKYNKEPE